MRNIGTLRPGRNTVVRCLSLPYVDDQGSMKVGRPLSTRQGKHRAFWVLVQEEDGRPFIMELRPSTDSKLALAVRDGSTKDLFHISEDDRKRRYVVQKVIAQ